MAGTSGDPVTAKQWMATRMEDAIRDAIDREVQAVREEIIKKAVEDFVYRVRQIVGRVSLQASDFYTVHNMGNELVIKVKIENGTGDTNRSLAR